MSESTKLDEMFRKLRNSEPYIADDGFTAGVMARLPEARQLPMWLTNLILLGFTAIGSALAAWQIPLMKLFSLVSVALQSLSLPGPLPVLGVAALGTFMLSYAVIWLAQNDTI